MMMMMTIMAFSYTRKMAFPDRKCRKVVNLLQCFQPKLKLRVSTEIKFVYCVRGCSNQYFEVASQQVYGCEEHIQTDTLKENKQIFVNWQHHLSIGWEKLLSAPYSVGALRGCSQDNTRRC